jgi:hypothetical protein
MNKKFNQKLKNIKENIDLKKHELALKNDLDNMSSNLNRARSVTVGTCFGGTTEVIMRSDGGRHIWCALQPVEVIELIHQLAANVGCHIAIKPRDDFSSWRDWRVSEAEKKHLNGWAPFVNDMAVFQQLGLTGFNQEKAEALLNFLAHQEEYEYVNGGATIKTNKEQQDANIMATKKNINSRKSKRTTTAS